MEDLLALAATPQAWAALATLVVMEVVLGIDNLIFISILTNKLPEHQRSRARRLGIGLAVILRLGLLASVRSEEHTSELQSQFHLVCRLLLEKKKTNATPRAGREKKKTNT